MISHVPTALDTSKNILLHEPVILIHYIVRTMHQCIMRSRKLHMVPRMLHTSIPITEERMEEVHGKPSLFSIQGKTSRTLTSIIRMNFSTLTGGKSSQTFILMSSFLIIAMCISRCINVLNMLISSY